MIPTDDQIREAAYQRWLHRGAADGWHDFDWLEAEQALLFALNYRVKVYGKCGALWPASACAENPICRFCEEAAPRARFSGQRRLLPAAAGLPSIVTSDLCDDCHDALRLATDQPLRDWITSGADGESIDLPAYRGLVAAALCLMPDSLVETCLEAIEWVAAEHDEQPLGAHLPSPRLHRFLGQRQEPSFALAAKLEPGAPHPAFIALLGQADWTLELAIPLCTLDDELDGERITLPSVPIIDGLLRWPGPVECRELCIEAPRRARQRRWEPALQSALAVSV